ncbi:hypothetical protein POM88_016214 [Heracleum sosnowskyi]|uniref:Uncharacterized protein n=1 Tax=Heracleum sosnowskyi TaxID=360622 RepID=A0AAD8MWP2_9APIA|nr:hypothetical protein POM88_016214 [Heracleum sosnowskyi]
MKNLDKDYIESEVQKISVLASDKTGEVQVILGDQEVRTLVGKRVHQIIKENGDDIFPQIVKDIANQHYTLKIRLKDMNIVDHIQVYSETNICHGFKNQQDEETEYTAQASNNTTSSTYNLGGMSDLNSLST